ncbi:FtsW/RodA/SpoVE family cell cycle protein [Clostridium chrysemydis]|uniref:FtsW/RodA/SpoVE family cell cycle protein n=1 Tax=Clostridium chrysemydis TaxID=2665504 RepID=UPI001EE59104|nr:FtsW/RodA/SpoVE family cell cycle protein [Clostridium chrysemydis]
MVFSIFDFSLFLLKIDYRIFYKYSNILYWFGIFLLILTKLLGSNIGGGTRWIVFGPISFQTTEVIKLFIIIMIGSRLENFNGNVNNIKNLINLILYLALPILFVFAQPDFGMSIVISFMVFCMIFISGLDMKIILSTIMLIVISLLLFWNIGIIKDYQKDRVLSFMNQSGDTSGQGYHLSQSLTSIGSGGVLGNRPSIKNDGKSSYAGYNVPEVQTDFIFAAIGEQFGLLGALTLLSAYGTMLFNMIKISKNSKDIFGSTVSVGIIAYFLLAILQNIGMTIGITPISGITLPLVSYGGSSLLTTILSIGIVLNIGMRKEPLRF